MSEFEAIANEAAAFRDFAEDYADEHSLTDKENKSILSFLVSQHQVDIYKRMAGLGRHKISVLP